MYKQKAPSLKELSGKIDSSLNYSKQMLSRKGTTEAQKIAYRNIKDHFDYYQKIKVDPEFMREMVTYHFTEALNRAEQPKTVLTSDKLKSNIAQDEIVVLMRLAENI